MKQNTIETIVGFIVIACATSFLLFVYNVNNKSVGANGYPIYARFQNVEGIFEGSDVKLAGIKIGVVEDLHLDKDTFFAMIKLCINDEIKLPIDSQASVLTNGFLGGKFISIMPGADDVLLLNNDHIKHTQSSINIESLIGQMIYSSSN